MPNSVFIIEPSHEGRRMLAVALAGVDADIRNFGSAEEFLRDVTPCASGCLVAPVDLTGMGIRGLLANLRARGLPLPVVVLGRDVDLERAVEAMREGAADYLEPPVSERRLRLAVHNLIGADTRT